MPVTDETGDLACHTEHGGPRETVFASRQRVGSDLDDEALFRPFSHDCRAHFISGYNLRLSLWFLVPVQIPGAGSSFEVLVPATLER